MTLLYNGADRHFILHSLQFLASVGKMVSYYNNIYREYIVNIARYVSEWNLYMKNGADTVLVMKIIKLWCLSA